MAVKEEVAAPPKFKGPGNLAICTEKDGSDSVVCGPWCSYVASGGRAGMFAGGHTREVRLDLANSTYTTGGYQFNPVYFGGLGAIGMMDVLGATDPSCNKIADDMMGVQLALDCTDPCFPRLIVCNEDGEVPEGWVPKKGSGKVWVRFYGCGA